MIEIETISINKHENQPLKKCSRETISQSIIYHSKPKLFWDYLTKLNNESGYTRYGQ